MRPLGREQFHGRFSRPPIVIYMGRTTSNISRRTVGHYSRQLECFTNLLHHYSTSISVLPLPGSLTLSRFAPSSPQRTVLFPVNYNICIPLLLFLFFFFSLSFIKPPLLINTEQNFRSPHGVATVLQCIYCSAVSKIHFMRS